MNTLKPCLQLQLIWESKAYNRVPIKLYFFFLQYFLSKFSTSKHRNTTINTAQTTTTYCGLEIGKLLMCSIHLSIYYGFSPWPQCCPTPFRDDPPHSLRSSTGPPLGTIRVGYKAMLIGSLFVCSPYLVPTNLIFGCLLHAIIQH